MTAACSTEVETVDGETIDMAREMNDVGRQMQEQAPKARSEEELREESYHQEFSGDGWGSNDTGHSEGWGD